MILDLDFRFAIERNPVATEAILKLYDRGITVGTTCGSGWLKLGISKQKEYLHYELNSTWSIM
jgi:hypothetical protein